MESLKVRDCMTTQAAVVSAQMSIITALRILLEKKQSAAAVVDDNQQLIGLLSEADCIQATLGGGIFEQDGQLVSDKMSIELETISADASAISSVDYFLKNKRRVIPVLEGKKLVGMLSRENILKALLHEIDHPTQHAHRA